MTNLNSAPAPVLHTPGDIPIPTWYVAPSIAVNGDEAIRTKRRTPGSLWERVAERAEIAEAELREYTDESSLSADMGWG